MWVLIAFFAILLAHVHTKSNGIVSQASWEDAISSQQKPKIAVCISGQVTRWQPTHIVSGLFQPNPQYLFYLFFNLQHDGGKSSNVYNTDPDLSFDQSAMADLSSHDASLHMARLLKGAPNTQIASMVYVRSAPAGRWEEVYNHSLDRIRDHVFIQSSILNMYAHQPRCIEQILAFEQRAKWKFHYVINTREDVFFFHPLQLAPLVGRLRHNPTDTRYLRFSSHPYNISLSATCDLPFKGCLNFWGFNMRFYVMLRSVAVRFLGQRLKFYGELYRWNRTVKNPEKFEYVQALKQGLRGCKVPVEELPATAVRHTHDGQFCFILLEYYQCTPRGSESLVKSRSCSALLRRESSVNNTIRR